MVSYGEEGLHAIGANTFAITDTTFEWKFTRKDLAELLAKVDNPCCPQEPKKYVSELLN